MSREIKFRIWDPENSDGATMHYTDLLTAFENCVCADINFNPPYYNNSDGKILMQYTGLKDKKVKEIYEGDIAKLSEGHPYWLNMLFSVVFYEGAFCLMPNIGYSGNTNKPTAFITYGDACLDNGLGQDFCQYIDVIGNIYQTPELLTPHK